MDSSIVESVFEDAGGSSDAFSPDAKPSKPKPLPKKAVTGLNATKPKGRPPKAATQTTLKPKTVAPKKRPKPESDDENSDHEGRPDKDDASLLSATPPSAKKQKKAAAPKKSSGKPLQPIKNESVGPEDIPSQSKTQKSATDQYQKLTQLEHILRRPDTYIGSVEREEHKMWVYNTNAETMECRDVSFVPGLYKIFDEILVNAADNKQRDASMTEIHVDFKKEIGEISVKNNGRGIPVEVHSKEGIYIPEMIFGHLLTGSNYDDNEQKVTGGRNGYGAKLCNVFSKQFTLETNDTVTGKRYKQTWTENMSKMGKASIVKASAKDFTMVTFRPDLAKFGMAEFDDDFEALVKRRVYDMAGTCRGVSVYLNGDKIKCNTFKKYMQMYTKAIQKEKEGSEETAPAAESQVIITEQPNERWEIGFAVSDGSFQQVSFVNSIATTSGGTHVNYIADQIINKLLGVIKKKDKGGVSLKNSQIKNHIFLFVNCLITNPAFTSQTKEQLTTKPSQFGSKCAISEKFLKAVEKSEAVNNILHFAAQKADQVLKKSDGTKRTRMNHSKLTDANKAGTKDGHRCTLILTEGDSASLLALAGRAVMDPDLIGVFPLRGKLLNVRDASIDQISKNQEIQNIKKFMGLQHKKHYEDTRGLRYGHLMIMTDQDHDGSHIKGLLINFFEVSFPSLLKIEGFLQEFITPIVKVWKGDPKDPKKLQSFFTMPEYEAWKELPGNGTGWDHKYYKGLGTSMTRDAEDYFSNLDQHLKTFAAMQPNEPELIELAFSKKKADARKEWLRQFRPGTFLDMTTEEITYTDFINKELILFSMADNLRSIPSVVDGLKPGQRKVLYTCFRRNQRKDIKVVELAGLVSGLTAYAYGDTSLQQTIVGLAQDFVGSNNINCLEPSGSFGSRLQGGSDSASPRYIYTRLSPLARKIFHACDEPLLTYNTDDGKTIEPVQYMPILPMILVNGADGIGTGWSSTIPNYNPEDIVTNLESRIDGSSKDDMKPMNPWFRGWKGETVPMGDERFKFSGTISKTGENEVRITELPIRVWTQDFKDRLEDILKAEKGPSFIKDYVEYNTPDRVDFIIKLDPAHMANVEKVGFEETFKLSKTLATTNLVAFDGQGRIHKYATVLDIMEEFYHIRLRQYERRKEYLLNEMQMELDKLNNQAKFIKMIVDEKLVVSKKKKSVLIEELRKLGFKAIPKVADARKQGENEPVVDPNDEESLEDAAETKSVGAGDFDYLLGMAIWSLTQERIDKLLKQIGDKEDERQSLLETPTKQLWKKDLQEFRQEWRSQLEQQVERAKKQAKKGRRASAKLRIGAKGGKKKKADVSDSDSEFGGDKSKKPVKSKIKGFLSSYITQKDPPRKPAKQTLISAFEQSPISRPPAEQQGLVTEQPPAFFSGAPVGEESKPIVNTKPQPVTDVPPKKSRQKKQILSDEDSDEDMFVEIAKEAATKPKAEQGLSRGGRQARTTTQKPISYANQGSSDASDDEVEDLLGDVKDMVKGIATQATSAVTSKPLFSNSASANGRPSSSHSMSGSKPAKRSKVPATIVSDDEVDETDYRSLVPKDSPMKPAARNAREVKSVSDDEEDDFALVPPPKAALKTIGKTEKAKTTKSVAAPKKEQKPQILSPAAKAYAAKQAKTKALGSNSVPAVPDNKTATAGTLKKPVKKKATIVLDDEDDVAMKSDSFAGSDDEVVSKPETKVAREPTARPSRRAAATKTKYVIEDEEDNEDEFGQGDEDDESSHDSFDDDSD